MCIFVCVHVCVNVCPCAAVHSNQRFNALAASQKVTSPPYPQPNSLISFAFLPSGGVSDRVQTMSVSVSRFIPRYKQVGLSCESAVSCIYQKFMNCKYLLFFPSPILLCKIAQAQRLYREYQFVFFPCQIFPIGPLTRPFMHKNVLMHSVNQH